MKEINSRHKLFIEEYLINGFNGLKAYQKVYPDASYETAQKNSSKLLTNTDIKQYISDSQQEMINKKEVTKENLIDLLYDIAKTADRNSDRISSINTLNKMLGFNEVRRIDITSDGKTLTDLIGFEEGE